MNALNSTEQFFGPDDVLNANEQCFQIGLHCTIDDHPSLVDGVTIQYQAYVQTDFDIRSGSQYITLNVISFLNPVQFSDPGIIHHICFFTD